MKLRLGHAAFGSMLLPELVFIKLASWRFYQPSFFGPPILGFNVEPGVHVARFSVDVGSPRQTEPTRLIIEIRSDGLVRRYDDGAQLYRCVIEGSSRVARFASGRCRPRADNDFDISLFHIHDPQGLRRDQEQRRAAIVPVEPPGHEGARKRHLRLFDELAFRRNRGGPAPDSDVFRRGHPFPDYLQPCAGEEPRTEGLPGKHKRADGEAAGDRRERSACSSPPADTSPDR